MAEIAPNLFKAVPKRTAKRTVAQAVKPCTIEVGFKM